MQNDVPKPIWGKLVPLSKKLQTHALRHQQTILGRRPQSHIQVKDNRLSGKHCSILRVQDKIFVVDHSTNGTYVGAERIGRDNRFQINDQSQVYLLPPTKVSQQESLGYKLVLLHPQKIKQKTQKLQKIQIKLSGRQLQNTQIKPPDKFMQKIQAKQHEKENKVALEKTEDQSKHNSFMDSIKEQITCPFCSDIMMYPVAVQPCNHRLCGVCLTELVLKKKGQCITCRKQITTAARDSTFNSIIDEYLRTHPECNRDDPDDGNNIFGYQPVNVQEIIEGKENLSKNQRNGPQTEAEPMEEDNLRLQQQNFQPFQQPEKQEKKNSKPKKSKQGKKDSKSRLIRTRGGKNKGVPLISSDISASTDSEPQAPPLQPVVVCKQCVQQRNGFKCAFDQIHVNCHNCTKPFAKRDDQSLNQSCAICKSYFCNLYMPPCQKNGPKLTILGKRAQSCVIQPLYFRNNKVEMEAFRNLLVSQKKTPRTMFAEMLQLANAGRFQFLCDKRIMRAPPVVQKKVKVNKRSPICDNCWRQLWFQMIFMFIKEYGYLMPESIRKRPLCYWGINCRTMEHNLDHAKRFNHMEFQTKF